MEARLTRAVLLTAVLTVSMGAQSMGAQFRTANFTIETRDPTLARQFGQTAEKFRKEVAVRWLGKAMPNWSQPCTMTVHVGPRLGAGGATSFVFDRGEVFGWRMTIQGSRERILDSVLPHEITHMVLASHFRCPLPRWADEGMASRAESRSEQAKHRKMLVRFLQTGHGIAFDRMLAMKQYPPDMMPLYVQGFSLADYLIQRGGRQKFLTFLADGMHEDQWATAIRRHYGTSDVRTLQDTWLAWVRQGSPAIGTTPERTMIAAAGRLPRPEPNLIYRVGGRQSRAYAPNGVVASKKAGGASGVEPCVASVPAKGEQLPSSGWHAVGTDPPRTVSVPEPRRLPPEPARGHLSRPQPWQQAQPRLSGG